MIQPTDSENLGDLRAGDLEVRLAKNTEDIEASQRLRYQIFYEEMGATRDPQAIAQKRDFDDFDPHADHLLVIDHKAGAIVGTYRLHRRKVAEKIGRFYAQSHFDIAPVLNYDDEILEVGRACVGKEYRNMPTMQLLWRGIAAYVFKHDIGLMFGRASLKGVDPDALAVPLSYLYHYHLAPDYLRGGAKNDLRVDMNLLPKDQLDAKRALMDLPTLIKGYLRLGGFVGDGAIVDHSFGVMDVLILVETDKVKEKYFKHYERSTQQAWAEKK